MEVARLGEQATPPVPAPGALKRYLRFARLPDPALGIARRVLEDDAGFRTRVGEATSEEQLGRAGWLWLTRPTGWEPEFEAIRKKANAAEVASKDDRTERDATRRLAGAEQALTRVGGQLLAATEEAARAATELTRERDARREVTEEVLVLRARVDELVAERRVAIARARDHETRIAERNAELRQARHQYRMLAAELDNALAGLPPGTAPPPPPAVVVATVEEEADPLDREAIALAVDTARQAAADLAAIIATAAELVGPPPPTPAPAHAAAPGDDDPARPSIPRRADPVRRPVPLPPGIHDDGPTAAEHLVRAPGALLLVDGYNVSHARWADHPVAAQRTRLLDACAELHARTAVDIEVVFDGAGAEASTGTLTRQAVRYRFTPAGVEADDVVLERIGEQPHDRPVVIASSDNRVRTGARRAGANVISAAQCLALLRRG